MRATGSTAGQYFFRLGLAPEAVAGPHSCEEFSVAGRDWLAPLAEAGLAAPVPVPAVGRERVLLPRPVVGPQPVQ